MKHRFSDIMLSTWLLKVANELDERFGDHPHVSRTETIKVMRELVDQSTAIDKTAMKLALEAQIKAAFKGSDLDE